MPPVRDLSEGQLAFQVSELELDVFQVMRFRGSEGICQLYRFEIDLATTETSIEFDNIVGKAAVLSINTAEGERWFHGIVGRFELTGETHDQTYFRAELVPTVWLLTHRYNSRIFQEKSVPDIISDVLTQAGVPSDRVEKSLSGTHEPRTYCVQYRETDYNFICRLMEEEGIWWYFEQTQDGHIFHLADSTSAYAPIEGEAKLPYAAPSGLNLEGEHVVRFRLGQEVRPGAVVLDDFNFENPKLDLQAKNDAGRDTGLEFSDYPGEYLQQSAGTDLARIRKEEFECGRKRGIGQSNCRRLAPGLTFELTDHPFSELNGTYLITTLVHEGKEAVIRTSTGAASRGGVLDARVLQSLINARQSDNAQIREVADALLQIAARLQHGDPTAHGALGQWIYHAGQVSADLAAVAGILGADPQAAIGVAGLLDGGDGRLVDADAPVYQCRFECIPSSVSYRPARVTPWPVMRGSQTARVVGPQGEEIYTDQYGRVKVQFNWDREGDFNENSSCWIRVAQPSAGGQYGLLFLPRIGQEVVVDFLEGDPDKPLIIGRVYNADQMPPYKLPDEKTKSVIKTHSSKGGGGTNEIRFEDLKDKEQLFIQAQRQMDTRVKADHFHTVGSSYHLHVGTEDGGELRELIYNAKHVHIKGELRTWVEKDEGRAVDGNQATEIKGTECLLVHKDAVDTYQASHKHEVTGTYELKAASIKLEASQGIEIKCGGSSVILAPGGIYIVGPTVYINSGAGPSVAPVSAGGYCPAAAEDAGTADSSEPGKDVSYAGGEELAAAETPEDIAGHEWEEDETEEEEESYIDIELTDEEGNPVPGERYRVTDSEGEVHEGSLDTNGKAHVIVPPGENQVTFPNLDDDAWDRTG